MKRLLLTSGGITNQTIGNALIETVGKPASETKVAFIPTAANVEEGNKDWFIDQFTNLRQHGFGWIDVVDPSASDLKWKPRLEYADVLFVSGGNTFHLLNQFRKSGFAEWLKSRIDSKVYVGASAGSIAVGSSIEVANLEPADPNLPGLTDLTGLNIVTFNIEPHYDNERFNVISKFASKVGTTLYAIDDDTAIRVVGDNIDFVSEGVWKKFN